MVPFWFGMFYHHDSGTKKRPWSRTPLLRGFRVLDSHPSWGKWSNWSCPTLLFRSYQTKLSKSTMRQMSLIQCQQIFLCTLLSPSEFPHHGLKLEDSEISDDDQKEQTGTLSALEEASSSAFLLKVELSGPCFFKHSMLNTTSSSFLIKCRGSNVPTQR